MTSRGAGIDDWSQLAAGDRVEVWREDRLIHRGEVWAVIPHLNLFWVTDAGTGTRELLDLDLLRALLCLILPGLSSDGLASET